jgi:AcrR family transcriptional regulator
MPRAATADDGSPRTVRAGTPAEGRALRSRGQKTVRRLLDAAEEVFAKRGYHPARVEDIVKAARTSHGTFYLYFASKEDVLRRLLLDVADELAVHAAALGPLTPDAKGRDALEAWLAGFNELYARHAPAIRAWVEAEMDDHQFGQLGSEVLGRFAGALTERITASEHVVDDPANAAVVVVAMIERANYYAAVGQTGANRDALARVLAGAVHRALFGTPSRA